MPRPARNSPIGVCPAMLGWTYRLSLGISPGVSPRYRPAFRPGLLSGLIIIPISCPAFRLAGNPQLHYSCNLGGYTAIGLKIIPMGSPGDVSMQQNAVIQLCLKPVFA
jgi:hypothetical protein